MVAALYTANVERLSAQAAIPHFTAMEQRCGSIARALRATTNRRGVLDEGGTASGPRYHLFLTLRGGLSMLVDALIRQMPEASLQRSTTVQRIEPACAAAGAGWTLHLANGQTVPADALCVALPSHDAAPLLRPWAAAAADALAEIPSESVVTVHMAFERRAVRHPLNGFGFVVPSVERRRIVGCTFSSVKFHGRAPRGMVLLRAFLGGATQRSLLELEDRALEQVVYDELRDLLGLRAAPCLVSIHRLPQAMPQYHIGHLARITSVEESLRCFPRLQVIGNSFRGVGLPECIRLAEAAAEQVWASLSVMPPRLLDHSGE